MATLNDAIIKNRTGTTEQWTKATKKLQKGEIGYDTDKNELKIGDGENLWSDLPLVNDKTKENDAKYVSDVTEGTVNGEISVTKNGQSSQVKVHGLGTAAYQNEEAFATADQGAKANSAVQPEALDDYMPKSGGQFTGPITFDETSLPQDSKANYFLVIDDYKMGYATPETVKNKLGLSNLPASQVILQDDITLAGNYSEVGNVEKTKDGQVFQAKGKSVEQLIQEIFSKRLQPKILQEPSASGLSFSQAGNSVEVGTHIDSIDVGTLVLNKGRYSYDEDTGVTATGYNIIRILDNNETSVGTSESVVDNNGDSGFIIGDTTNLRYKGEITYSAGSVANDNLGSPSDPPIQIEAGTATTTTGALTGYRAYFYGHVSTTPSSAINSALIRGLQNKSSRAYSATSFTMNVPVGATALYIACVSSKTGVTKVMNTSNQTDITSVFTKQENVAVEGANNYTSTNYNVWYYVPAVPFEANASLTVTLG